MTKDPIIEELWKVKDQIAKECNYDLNKLAARLKEKERAHKHRGNRPNSKQIQK